MAHITHNGKEYPIPEGCTAEQTLEALRGSIPELAGAELKKDGPENFRVNVNVGRKG